MREPLDLKSAADVRAAIARDKLKLYLVAARVHVHPSRLSLIVNGRAPLTPELAERLAQAIADGAGQE